MTRGKNIENVINPWKSNKKRYNSVISDLISLLRFKVTREIQMIKPDLHLKTKISPKFYEIPYVFLQN